MNPVGRKPVIPYAELEPRLRELRLVHGLSMKELAQRFGYSVDHIKDLCYRFGIKVRNYPPKIAVDDPNKNLGPSKVRQGGSVVSHQVVAAPDSALGNSPTGDL